MAVVRGPRGPIKGDFYWSTNEKPHTLREYDGQRWVARGTDPIDGLIWADGDDEPVTAVFFDGEWHKVKARL